MVKSEKERMHAGLENGWIQVGSFGAPHGVRGDVRLKAFTEKPAAVFDFKDTHLGPNGEAVKMRKVSTNKDGFIVHVEGIDTPEATFVLKSKGVFVPRSALDIAAEDEFYLADLIGLEARDTNGDRIGTVNAVENFGAEDLIELTLDTPIKGLGRYAFIPFRTELMPHVDIAGGFLSVDMASWQEIQTGKVAESQMNQEDSQ